MAFARGGSAAVGALLVAVLTGACSASEPAATGSPEPTQISVSSTDSASPSRSQSTSQTPSPTPPPLPMIGWGDGRYGVPCLTGSPTVKVEDGRADYRGTTVIARVVARGELAGYQSVSVHVMCIGASGSPSSVLVYIGGMAGPKYVGLALSPDEFLDLRRARYVGGELRLVSDGFTRRAPLCCPDLLVTKTVALQDGELVRTGLTKERLTD